MDNNVNLNRQFTIDMLNRGYGQQQPQQQMMGQGMMAQPMEQPIIEPDVYNYYKQMFDSFAGNPKLQNDILLQYYDQINPERIAAKKRQQQQQETLNRILQEEMQIRNMQNMGFSPEQIKVYMQGIGRGMQATDAQQMAGNFAGYLAPGTVRMTDSELQSRMAANPNYMNNLAAQQQMYEIQEPETQSQIGDALGTISQSALPALGAMSTANPLNKFASSLGQAFTGMSPDEYREARSWNTIKKGLEASDFGRGLVNTVKETPFLNDLARRFADVSNTASGYRSFPGYKT